MAESDTDSNFIKYFGIMSNTRKFLHWNSFGNSRLSTQQSEESDEDTDVYCYEEDSYQWEYKQRRKDVKRKRNRNIRPSKCRQEIASCISGELKHREENCEKMFLQCIAPLHDKTSKKVLLTTELHKLVRKCECQIDQNIKRRNNTEKRLVKCNLKRYSMYACSPAFLSSRQKHDRNHNLGLGKYSLTSIHDTILDIQKQKVQLLIDLQYREVMPEDYELLLLLDESVSSKVASKNTMNKLNAEVSNKSSELCVICVDKINNRDMVIILPKCKHVFHEICITTWLTSASHLCPIDNSEV